MSRSTSCASGITATVTVEVWMRPLASVAGTRWTRWTPLSYFIRLETSAPQPKEIFDFAIYSLSDYDERAEFARDLTDYISDRRSEFCTGLMDPNSDADWQTYLDGLDRLKYDRWIELAQIGYNRIFA